MATGKSGKFAGSTVAYAPGSNGKFANEVVDNPVIEASELRAAAEPPLSAAAPADKPPRDEPSPKSLFDPSDLPVQVGLHRLDDLDPSSDIQSESSTATANDEVEKMAPGMPQMSPESPPAAPNVEKGSIPGETPQKAARSDPEGSREGRPTSRSAVRKKQKSSTGVSPQSQSSGSETSQQASIFHQDAAAISPAPNSNGSKHRPRDINDPRIAFFDVEPQAPRTVVGKSKEGAGRAVRWVLGVVVGVALGLLGVGYLMIVIGPYQLTDLGVVREDTGIAVNALPPGTEVTIVRNGSKPPSGLSRVNPIVLGVSHVVIDERTQLEDGTPAYQVTCLDGSCPEGIRAVVPFDAVLGGAPGA